MTSKKIQIISGILSALLLSVSGCSTDIAITALPDSSGGLHAVLSAGPAAEKTFTALTGTETTGTGPDTDAIQKNLEEAGLTAVTVSADGTSSLTVQGTVKNLAAGITAFPGFISGTTDKSGKHQFTVTFSPDIMQKAVKAFPETIQNYADLLMAPVFTGETMTQQEYKELLAAVYGNSFAEELAESTVRISFSSPAAAVQNEAIPLLELLTLKKTKIISFIW
jgi:hypothetical protein